MIIIIIIHILYLVTTQLTGPYTLLRQINHAVLCYVNVKLSRNQSSVYLLFSVLWDSIVDWILDNLLSILNSQFMQESRIKSRIKTRNGL